MKSAPDSAILEELKSFLMHANMPHATGKAEVKTEADGSELSNLRRRVSDAR
jgi:hypothetical protein